MLPWAAIAAPPAATLSPDHHQLLISRDVAGLRWLIALDLASGAVSGNVLDPVRGEARFVRCTLSDVRAGDLLYRCFGAERCDGAECSHEWDAIGDAVPLPIGYFRAGTFGQKPEAFLGHWSGFAQGADFSEIVTRDGVPAVRGATDYGFIFAKLVGDGVASFAYELLDDTVPAGTCDLYRFNQIGPGSLGGVRYQIHRQADRSCPLGAAELVGWFGAFQ